MFGILLYDILFFAIPAALLAFWGISIYRYITAKKKNAQAPGSFSAQELKKRKTILVITSVIAGVFLAVVLGFIALLFMAVAFM